MNAVPIVIALFSHSFFFNTDDKSCSGFACISLFLQNLTELFYFLKFVFIFVEGSRRSTAGVHNLKE